MRRPMAAVGFTFLIASLFYIVFGEPVARWSIGGAGVLLAVCLLLLRRQRQNRRLILLGSCCLSLVCAFLLMLVTASMYIKPLTAAENTTQSLTATVISEDGQYDTAGYYIVSTDDLVTQAHRTLRIRLKTDSMTQLSPGDVIAATVTVKPLPSYNRFRYYSDRVWLAATADTLTVTGHDNTLYAYAQRARSYIKSYFQAHLAAEPAAMLAGICLGDTSGLPDAISRAFYTCGMGHMVAVSGLHTGAVGGLFVLIFLLLRTGKRYAKALSVGFVWGFVIISGLSFSSIRAAVMFTVFAGGSLFFRRIDLLNTLGLAVLAILLIFPFAAGSIGFLASVSACLGIILFATPLTNAGIRCLPKGMQSNRLLRRMLQGLSITVAATAAMFPCNLLRFRTLSLVSPITNLLGVPLAGIILGCGLLSVLLSLIPGLGFTGRLVLSVAGLAAKGLTGIARFFSRFSFACLPQATGWCLLAAILLAIGLFVLYRHRQRLSPVLKRSLCLFLILLLSASSLLPAYLPREYEVMVVGNGYDASVIIAGRDATAVIGCAACYRVQSVLASRGIRRVDYLLLPKRDSYGQDLRNFLQLLDTRVMVTDAETVAKGLLTGQVGDRTLTHTATVRFGEVTVTADPGFTGFTITVGQTRIAYLDSGTTTSPVPLTVVGRAASREGTLCLVREGQRIPVAETLIMRIRNNTLRLYCPRFIYG